MGVDMGGKFVVFMGIVFRFVCLEIIVEYGVEIDFGS